MLSLGRAARYISPAKVRCIPAFACLSIGIVWLHVATVWLAPCAGMKFLSMLCVSGMMAGWACAGRCPAVLGVAQQNANTAKRSVGVNRVRATCFFAFSLCCIAVPSAGWVLCVFCACMCTHCLRPCLSTKHCK